ncbi:DeoR/GlpR family DNA-binding transcription regulator [Martelella mediterranea]|uniref:DeoR/GlpR family DNA-binding transcription regulator n=1 Tax=Martelella mediterranea TaxID=293089 RepID=UPI001E4646A3|nr:DeoR/GlpR family DNA-binding transcription regulator [Martelella mediterranea]MCD1635521.1 DeoR/GlpR family DNA-binding transcription regulator [Martelella mediterranea]
MNDYLIRERQDIILGRLKASGRVLAADLAAEFKVSEDTIRRDLRDLAARGLCERVYGGALPIAPARGTLGHRKSRDAGEKEMLGRMLAAQIEDGMTVFFDASSTNIAAARALAEDRAVTVVTNAPAIATVFDGRESQTVIMIGGMIHPEVGGAIGARAIAELERFHFDLCLIGACGLDIEAGLTCFHYDDALFKREIALHARRVITAVTADKLETRAPCSVIALEALDGLVTSPGLKPESRAALLQAGVNLIETTDGIAAR